MKDKSVYANALLKDGKIMFWWTGLDRCQIPQDFYKDFYCAGMKMIEELETGRYSLATAEMEQKGNAGFEEAEGWYRQYEIHPDSKGQPAYT